MKTTNGTDSAPLPEVGRVADFCEFFFPIARRENMAVGVVVFTVAEFSIGDAGAVDEIASDRFRSIFRKGDIISKGAPGEYIVILPSVRDRETLEKIVMKTVDSLGRSMSIHEMNEQGNESTRIIANGAKAGVCLFPGDDIVWNRLLANAREALESAERVNSSYVFWRDI